MVLVNETPLTPESAHVADPSAPLPRVHHYMNSDGTCHAGDLFEQGTEFVVLYTAEELVRIVNAEKAEAFAQGVRAVQAEAELWCSRSFACTRTPTNPYGVRASTP